MLRLGCRSTLGVVLRRQAEITRYSSTSVPHAVHPNAPLELDPAFQALLKDVEISLHNKASGSFTPRELEVYPDDPDAEMDYLTSAELDAQDDLLDKKEGRKSPAAAFGSQRVASVVLPSELQSTIGRMIAESDKHALRHDAQRLFMKAGSSQAEWIPSYDVKYKSGKEAGRHAMSDATAFATVALPAHYSAIYAVLDHVKQRLGPEWDVRRVFDWGAATGSGLWASGHAFQRHGDAQIRAPGDMEDIQISHTSLDSYLGIDKREGLVRIGKRLMRDVEMGGLSVAWQKSFHEDDVIARPDGSNVMALSAFLLSSLPTHVDRKLLVKEMWNSGAEVIVLIDNNFELVAESREYLLKLGRKELEDPELETVTPKGAHVVAPCPHDGACPLYHPGYGKLECSFAQRMQRPEFVRKTKHSGTGHEDTSYSYAVIRRGPRPVRPSMKVGRIGDVGRRELVKDDQSLSVTELQLDANQQHALELVDQVALPLEDVGSDVVALTPAETAATLRQEAYSWPRLVFPPLKRSGHMILDGCTAEGQIMRLTIPRSQGKQPFYDARKSSWGDIFPHEPKNPPQVRHQPSRPGHTPTEGQDIGKRRHMRNHGKKASYGQLAEDIKQSRKSQRRARRLADAYADDED
ncbi:mitochondrial small ribosomal subunit Rsm22-domain-containing protein [Daedaleopsis nitida]|nr:mitochondrial small ribosomal subunit Rsm22-domain-containing protein [Daedaleopsis nitida]